MTSQQIIDKLTQIELYRINPRRSPIDSELEWEKSNVFYAKPTERQFYPKLELDYDKKYIIECLDCDRGSAKVKLKGVDKLFDYKEFTYSLEADSTDLVVNKEPEAKYLETYKNKFSNSDLYFLIVGSSVKIGMTTDLHIRLKTLSTSIPQEFEVYIFRGKGFAEKPLHKFFKSYHKRGEWFDMNERIMNLINNYGEFVDIDDIKVPPHLKSHILKFGKYINKDVVNLVKNEYSHCKSLVRYNQVPDKVKRFITYYHTFPNKNL